MKTFSSFFLVISLVFLPCLHADISNLGQEQFQKGLSAMNEGNLRQAEDAFKEALLVEPMNPEYHFELANLYAMQHDDSLSVGDELGASNRMNLAANELEQAVMAKPDYLPAHYNLGVVYKKLKQYEKARQEFKTVLKLDPSQAAATVQIASTYEEQGFYDEAETIYLEVRERFPNHPDLQEAIQNLCQRRAEAQMEARMEQQSRMQMLNANLSGLSQKRAQYGAVDPYPQQSSGGVGQALPFLGSWALQQFMKRKTNAQ